MHLITAEIQNYIRCIKMLWNEFYRALPDGEHDFTDVQRLVWKTLVIKLLQDTVEEISDGEIIVVAKKPAGTVLVGQASQQERAVSWREDSRNLDGQRFLFESFFDFRNWEDPRELQFVKVTSTTWPGEHMLLATDEVEFYYRERRRN